MNPIKELGLFQVISAYIFVLLILIILKKRGIKREKELIIASLRMSIQLVITGYILVYVLGNPNPFTTAVIIVIMQTFTIRTVFKRFKGKLSQSLKKIVTLSIICGTSVTLIYFLFMVIRIKPWFNPQYFIPIAGMLIGNAMTGISLGLNSLVNGMTLQKNYVEEALILGASPQQATKTIVDNAFDSAIMPTINSMIGMGIVSLPGMMTGQILSGTSPITAITYQISIMLGIMGSVGLTVILLLHFGYKSYFNKNHQLI